MLAASALACSAASNDVPTVKIGGASAPPVIVTASPSASAAATDRPGPTRIDWLTSEEDARSRAKARKLPLLVFLFATWAVPAARMERDVWTDPRIVARSSDFVALRLDVTEADANAQAQADHFDLNVMPSTILLDDLGHEIGRLEGFAGPDQVLGLLDRGGAQGD